MVKKETDGKEHGEWHQSWSN